MEEDNRTIEEAYQSAVETTVVHFFSLASRYRARGRRFGLSYARIWAEAYLLFEAIYEDMVRQFTYPKHSFAIGEGIDDACHALAQLLDARLLGLSGVAYFDSVSQTWQTAARDLRPKFGVQEREALAGYPQESPESFHFRVNEAMAAVPLFLLDLNGITIRPVDIETLRQRVKHLAARHLTQDQAPLIGDYRHGVEIAMFCVERIIEERGAMTATQLLELLEVRLEDFWVPQRSPFEETRNYPFDPANEAHNKPGHWPKYKYGL